MNWIEELSDLYEKNRGIAGQVLYKTYQTKNGEERTPLILLPIFHTTVTAQITVTIDENGVFLGAEPVSDSDKLTIIPVTDKSLARTANPEPHPLCDNLKYLSGDYMLHCKSKKDKDFSNYYTVYIKSLQEWHESSFTHEKVNAIYYYLIKGTLIHDLIESKVLQLDEEGRVSDKEKIQNVSQADSFVRFRVMRALHEEDKIFADNTGKFCSECWMDQTLQQSFIDYCRSKQNVRDLCYLSGEVTAISYLHPKKIRHEGDGAKLISSNDEQNYTFRGRFKDKSEAFSIGYELSQKAHNALKWIIRKQGYRWDELYVVIWESDLCILPDIYADTDTVCENYMSTAASSQCVGGNSAAEDDEDAWGDEDEQQETTPYAGTDARGAKRFQAAMRGYERNLKPGSRTVLMALDAATTGRLAMTEFKAMATSRYIENIQYWHESSEWLHGKFKDKRYYTYRGIAGVKDIAEILYGVERSGILTLDGKTRLYAQVVKRLLPCISERAPVPEDMVNLAFRKASSPVSYESRYNWERVVSVACSFIKKQRKEQKREEWNVALDQECDNRNYLYGRLLATADRIEYRTYEKEDGRTTNAKRYMTAFSQRPFSTWKNLEEKLQPYLQKLKPWERIKYMELLDEIADKFTVKNFECDEPLNGLYLLGFHSQSCDLKKSKGEKEEENNE